MNYNLQTIRGQENLLVDFFDVEFDLRTKFITKFVVENTFDLEEFILDFSKDLSPYGIHKIDVAINVECKNLLTTILFKKYQYVPEDYLGIVMADDGDPLCEFKNQQEREFYIRTFKEKSDAYARIITMLFIYLLVNSIMQDFNRKSEYRMANEKMDTSLIRENRESITRIENVFKKMLNHYIHVLDDNPIVHEKVVNVWNILNKNEIERQEVLADSVFGGVVGGLLGGPLGMVAGAAISNYFSKKK